MSGMSTSSSTSSRSSSRSGSGIGLKISNFLKLSDNNTEPKTPKSPRSPKTSKLPKSPKKICGSVVKFIRQLSGDKLEIPLQSFEVQEDIKPFFSHKMINMDCITESKIYSEESRVDILFENKLIGFATRKNTVKYTYDPYTKTSYGYWEGYTIIPSFNTPDENVYFFDYMFSVTGNNAMDPNVPDITSNISKISAVGWDHNSEITFFGDIVSYVNLAQTIMEIWSVWKCVRDYQMMCGNPVDN
ncbi:hypothetical protein QKC54_gp0786 [Megavirus baoshan]|uniref:Uncharacterized protein n=1 Tax=Megavirus baoshan TaxID=2496520 RepID=A0A3S5HLG2_9VIRU|nr:hypothetical protein QKC54_gp0786 [Megavirus baoshan]AZL89902.1 hypothetical protein Mb0286 [Megavirus baoshan]